MAGAGLTATAGSGVLVVIGGIGVGMAVTWVAETVVDSVVDWGRDQLCPVWTIGPDGQPVPLAGQGGPGGRPLTGYHYGSGHGSTGSSGGKPGCTDNCPPKSK